MRNLVPSGWCSGALTEFTDLKHGFQFRTPDFSDKGIKVVKIGQVIGGGKIDLSTCDYVLPEVYEMRKSFSLKTGDILMSLTGNIGRVGIVPELAEPLLQNYRVGLFEPNSDACFKWYLFHLLSSEFVTNQLLDKSNTTAQANFGKSDLDQVVVTLPPLPEQQKIAAILTSVDEVIESTQAQINKLKDLKTGMMQELLTNGIGHTEFKDSPVGRIPKEWSTSTIGELAEQVKPGPFGSAITKSMYVESGFKVYGQEQVIAGDLKVGNYYIDKSKFEELSMFKISAGDILISLVGTFGQVLVVPQDYEEGIINPRLLKLRMPKNEVSPHFIAHQLKSEFVVDQLNKFQQGGTMGVLSGSTLKPVKLVVPTYDEQVQITNILDNIDLNICSKEQKKIQLINCKKALMQDLLTGKIRVKVS